jgi:hypothetical protein
MLGALLLANTLGSLSLAEASGSRGGEAAASQVTVIEGRQLGLLQPLDHGFEP